MLTAQGYDADKNFNALYGNKQLYFAHGSTGLAIDVLIDKLHMVTRSSSPIALRGCRTRLTRSTY